MKYLLLLSLLSPAAWAGTVTMELTESQVQAVETHDTRTEEIKAADALRAVKFPKVVDFPDCSPFHVLTLESKKSSFSLDPFKHMKDSSNAVKFSLAVDKRLYDKVQLHKELKQSSTWGTSFLFGGTPGSIKITVVGKNVRPCQPVQGDVRD
jgi:hypothetical protein